MKNKVIRAFILLFSALIIFTSLPVSAEKVTSDGFEYTVINGEAEIIAYEGSAENIIIPSEIEGYPVTSIGFLAFKNCTTLKSIVIPESITTIVDSAFLNCSSLKSVTLPPSISSIPDSTFSDCISLESIDIPEGISSIGGFAFSGCTALKSVSLPKSIKDIGYAAFNGCTSVSDVHYNGTREEWIEVRVNDYSGLNRSAIHFEKTEMQKNPSIGKDLLIYLLAGLIIIAIISALIYLFKRIRSIFSKRLK